MGKAFPSLAGCCVLALALLRLCAGLAEYAQSQYVSALGDPGMKSAGVRVALEGWNFCNEVGSEAPGQGSPRQADCTDLSCSSLQDRVGSCLHCQSTGCRVNRRVTEADNKLSAGNPFPNDSFVPDEDPDKYAVQKELYLGSLCQVDSPQGPWQFWMIMLKNGNYDTTSGLCPRNGKKVPFPGDRTFPCFGKGCMNQPLVLHDWSQPQSGANNTSLSGRFYGTYDLDADNRTLCGSGGASCYSVQWEKDPRTGSWVFRHTLTTSKKYPWLMLYLRADATQGFSGGYHYETRGMMVRLPESPDFKVRLTLNVTRGGGSKSQFYLLDIGSCWKNNGRPCNGDVESDVTRYSEMILNPAVKPWCTHHNLDVCPPYHITSEGVKIYRNDTRRFPYAAYHLYCSPGNGKHLEEPYNLCDPYSNPQAQELVQILPHPEWAAYGYPSQPGQGWVGDPRTWELDVGALSSRLYFYQDPGTAPARRVWTSVDVGTEIYITKSPQTAEWSLSDFDVLIPNPPTS